MINAKVKVLCGDYPFHLEKELNDFLETIDVRQIIKTEHSAAGSASYFKYTTVIYYVELADVRDVKIDNVLEIK